MYYPIKLGAQNFQSFKNLEYHFSRGRVILVTGQNLTDEGQENNGSGKSSLQEIIYYNLLGTSSTGKRDLKLVRWGENSSLIYMHLYNSITKKTLVVEREIFVKKSSTLAMYLVDENGKKEDLKDKYSSVAEGNKLLLEMIDISSDDIKNYFLINREKFVSFFSSPDSKKRELIGRFSSSERLLEYETIFTNKVQKLNTLLNQKKYAFDKETTIQETITRQIATIIEFYNESNIIELIEKKKQEIDFYKKELTSNKSTINDLKQQLVSFNHNLDEFNFLYNIHEKAIKKLRKISYKDKLDEIEKELATLQQQANTIRKEKEDGLSEIYQFKQDLNKLNLIVAGTIECPKCKFTWNPSQEESITIDDAHALIQEVSIEITNMNNKVDDLEKQFQKAYSPNNPIYKRCSDERNRLLSQDSRRSSLIKFHQNENSLLINKISFLERTIPTTQNDINRLTKSSITTESYIEDKFEEIKNLDSAKMSDSDVSQIEALTLNITQSKERQKISEEEVNKIEDDIANTNLWMERFKQFYIFVTNKSLSTIEGHCNNFLEKIKTSLQIKFEGVKTLANGSIKDSITAKIFREGIEEEDYRCFSGGERGRLILSTILTFQHLINSKSKSGGLDLLFIDEILDQVDSEGMRVFIESLSSIDRTILITSQIKTKEIDDNVLTIVKENGISTIL